MKIIFSSHALKRISERGIDKKVVFEAIMSPDKIEPSNIQKNRFLTKKICFNKKLKKDHLLIIVCEKENNVLKVITIIDTSKISKHF